MSRSKLSPRAGAVLAIIGVIVIITGIIIGTTVSRSDNSDIPAPTLDKLHAQDTFLFGNASANNTVDVIIEPLCPTCHAFMTAYIDRKLLNSILSGTTALRLYPVSFLSATGVSETIINGWENVYVQDTSRFKTSTLKLIRDTSPKFVLGSLTPSDVASLLGTDEDSLMDVDTVSGASRKIRAGRKYVTVLPDEQRATPAIIHNGNIVETEDDLNRLAG